MLQEDHYFKTLKQEELWQRYCGFLDLSIDDFMDIQKELLMDEIERVSDSILGKKIMNNHKPKSVEGFRQKVPITTYEDYEPYLSNRQEDALAEKPRIWCHSAGKQGKFKWIPHGTEYPDRIAKAFLGFLILSLTRRRGQVNLSPGFRFLCTVPPPPYTSGFAVQALGNTFTFNAIPPLETMARMEFRDRIKKGFNLALRDGVDVIAAVSSILVSMGEAMQSQAHTAKFSLSMLHPNILFRMGRAIIRSKREKRGILPKDLWPVKAILASGVDNEIYKDDMVHYWGVDPYEFYACAEAFLLAVQDWNRKGLVFLPDFVFLEFIPEEDRVRNPGVDDRHRSTVLLNELEKGKIYEVVITQFYGMPLMRYRMKDLIRVISLRDEEADVNLPHIMFERRVGETINLGSMADLDEKTIWKAMVDSGLKFADWAACKEYDSNQSFLRIYVELKEKRDSDEVASLIDESLKQIDVDYRDVEGYLGLQPVRVTLLSPGTFQRYMEEKEKQGADLAHLKPTHINAPETVVQRLIELSQE